MENKRGNDEVPIDSCQKSYKLNTLFIEYRVDRW